MAKHTPIKHDDTEYSKRLAICNVCEYKEGRFCHGAGKSGCNKNIIENKCKPGNNYRCPKNKWN